MVVHMNFGVVEARLLGEEGRGGCAAGRREIRYVAD